MVYAVDTMQRDPRMSSQRLFGSGYAGLGNRE